MDGPLVVRPKIHQIFQSPRYKDNKLSSANVYGKLSPSTSCIREALAFDKFAGVLLRSAGGGCKWSAAAIKWRAAATSGGPNPSSARLQDDFAIRLHHSISQTRISGGGSGVLHGVRLGGSGNIAPGLGPGFEVFPIEMRTFRISQNFESSAVPIAKPVLKMLDQLENTLVRWNTPEKYGDFTTVFLGDTRAYFADTPEVTNAELKPFVG